MLRLENIEVRDIAAKLNVSKSRIHYLLRRSFNKIKDSQPVLMIDAYIDILNRYELSKEKWEEILGGELNYNYMELRLKYGGFYYRYGYPISEISRAYWIPEPIRQHLMNS